MDSIYSPVLKVTYQVEATRVEQRTDFDRLVLDVETKPSIAPRDAVASAGKTLVELFGLARDLNVEAEGIEIGVAAPVAETLSSDLALRPIEILNLPARSKNCLQREGIHTIGELIQRSEADLLDIRNFGTKSIEEIKESLATLGMALKDSPCPVRVADPERTIFSDDRASSPTDLQVQRPHSYPGDNYMPKPTKGPRLGASAAHQRKIIANLSRP